MDYCGYSDEAHEEGFCRKHAAELVGITSNRLNGLIVSGRVEAWKNQPTPGGLFLCGRRARLRALITQGTIFELQDIEEERRLRESVSSNG